MKGECMRGARVTSSCLRRASVFIGFGVREMLGDLLRVIGGQPVPSGAVAVNVDPAAVRAHHEVVDVHTDDDVVQRVRDICPQSVVALRPSPSAATSAGSSESRPVRSAAGSCAAETDVG